MILELRVECLQLHVNFVVKDYNKRMNATQNKQLAEYLQISTASVK